MRVCVYGLPCAGKDYLIESLNVPSVKGSSYLQDISGDRFGELSEEDKRRCRKKLIEHLRTFDSDNLFIDGHFAFPDESGYKLAFTEEDGEFYDVFIYLDTPVDVIYDRIQSSEKNTVYSELDEIALSEWKEFEITGLRDECFRRRKEFIILNGEHDDHVMFINRLLEGSVRSSVDVARIIANDILSKSDNQIICLLDCDKTVAINDTTNDLVQGKDLERRKKMFSGDRYSIYQFDVVERLYVGQECLSDMKHSASEGVIISDSLVSDIQSINEATIVGLTAGFRDVWSKISQDIGFFDQIYGLDVEENIVVTQFVKGFVVENLRKAGKYVIAAGDSIVDLYMLLSSDRAYAISHKSINDSLRSVLSDDSRGICQPSYNGHLFENVRVVRTIHEDSIQS